MGLGSPRVAKGGDPYRNPNGASQDILISNRVHRLQTILAVLHMGVRGAKLRFWVPLRLKCLLLITQILAIFSLRV
jgi:hypothetical protein